MSYLVVFAFVAIVGSLAAALFFMLRGGQSSEATPDKSKRMVRALAMRVGVSIVLFVCILIAWKFGLIQPTGIPPGR
jgi:hypothetical protein